MTYVITSSCLDIKDMSCIEECPVDAIYPDRTLPEDKVEDKEDNRVFFYEPLPGKDEPLNSPGGSMKTGPIELDTARTAALPPNPDAD